MGLWSRLVGKSESAEQRTPGEFLERDNVGTRQDTDEKSSAYWINRNASQKFEPYILHAFPTEGAAREALLEVPCIHEAKDTGALVCTETLTFGVYRFSQDGTFHAILAGEDLTVETFEAAKAAFAKHGGRPFRTGEQAPTKRVSPRPRAAKSRGSVRFVREERQDRGGIEMIYRIHEAPDAATAQAFLQQNPVTQPLVYLVVETPEGNYCRDVQGMYKE
ncbi:MAG TPA: hypothetical protein VM681_01005 [Candidatus Thermoplasmatota archaeon]|nr:hypothetical protein [Candidatus Thermoplasmatota archaeon]